MKGNRLIRKFKIPVLVTPDRNRWDGRKWSQTMEQIFFLVFSSLQFRFFADTNKMKAAYTAYSLQRRVCSVVYLFLIHICYVWRRGRCWSGTFFASNSQVKHFEVRKHTNCKVKGRQRNATEGSLGWWAKELIWEVGKKSIGNALQYDIMILNSYHGVP